MISSAGAVGTSNGQGDEMMTKCERDGKAKCEADAKAKNLHGAAETSFIKKCIKDATG